MYFPRVKVEKLHIPKQRARERLKVVSREEQISPGTVRYRPWRRDHPSR
jgi:hypothetical protein